MSLFESLFCVDSQIALHNLNNHQAAPLTLPYRPALVTKAFILSTAVIHQKYSTPLPVTIVNIVILDSL